MPQAAAAPLSGPGGRVSDPVVRQVDIARPAVVRIITKLGARLTVHFDPTGQVATFPLDGSPYTIELSGSGAFISAHGDVLTADHVVNPPHDQSLNGAIYDIAAQDIADYVNAHFRTNQPFTRDDAIANLQAGAFPSTAAYDPPSSEVYLSTSYTGKLAASRIRDLSAGDHAAVDRIEAQSSFDAMDVAIIHVAGMDDMPSIQLDDSSQVAEQDSLTVIGFPGLADVSTSPTNLLTSSINKLYVSAIKTTDSNAQVIQVGGNIEHGDSGGPVLDESGHIVGIVSFGLFNPNESGETSFLQASNSARTLIQAQSLDTTPGSFQRAWAQAFNDYASSVTGHWHKAFSELQTLANSHPGFMGVNTYLSYAQQQAGSEQLPTTATGPNPVLIIVLVLILVLVLVMVLFFVMKRRSQVALAGATHLASAPYGMYVPQQSGVQGTYGSMPGSYNSGAYPPVSVNAGAPVPLSTSGTYPPTPESYSSAAWYEQSTGQVPQTPPLAGATSLPSTPAQMTEPAAAGVDAARTPVLLPLTASDGVAPQAEHVSAPYEHVLPTWAPTQQTPHSVSASTLSTWEQTVSQPGQPESEVGQNGAPRLAGGQIAEGQQLASAQDVDKTLLAQPPANSLWNFAVPRRPVTPVNVNQETSAEPTSIFSGMYSWIAPCGHANTPDIRFCRVCGQPVQASNTPGASLP
ncbi:MAG TPA: trypsin-like peptidase domain-containing protein [Ktedonobacteraceae bacterium]|nr:trypsin-like peptidase domain-containing protein [Ktedonobacteraceae bacterium]